MQCVRNRGDTNPRTRWGTASRCAALPRLRVGTPRGRCQAGRDGSAHAWTVAHATSQGLIERRVGCLGFRHGSTNNANAT